MINSLKKNIYIYIYISLMYLLFLMVSLSLRTLLEGSGLRKWKNKDWGEMCSSKSLTVSKYSLTFSRRVWYYLFSLGRTLTTPKNNNKRFGKHKYTSIETRKCITNKGRTRHMSPLTTKQLGSFTRILTKYGLPIFTKDRQKAHLLVSKRRRGIKNQPRAPILGFELLITRVLRASQAVQVQKFIYPNGVSIISWHPHHHTSNNYPPQVGD